MLDTVDLDSYYPGYDEYCEPKVEIEDDDSYIDYLIDEDRLEAVFIFWEMITNDQKQS